MSSCFQVAPEIVREGRSRAVAFCGILLEGLANNRVDIFLGVAASEVFPASKPASRPTPWPPRRELRQMATAARYRQSP